MLADLAARWRLKAEQLERFAPAAATAFRDAALDLESELRAVEDETLTLSEAAQSSGFSVDHLRHLVAAGAIANAGRKGAPRIRRADLPRRAPKATGSTYDPHQDALQLLGGREGQQQRTSRGSAAGVRGAR